MSIRVISLLPGATEMVAALGAGDLLVGRSHECDFPLEVQALPVCTQARLQSQKPSGAIDADVKALLRAALNIYDLQLDTMRELQPTHIVTQDQCDVCAVSVATVEQALAELLASDIRPQVVSCKGETLAGVWDDMARVGRALGLDPDPALAALQARVENCTQKVNGAIAAGKPRPRVAAIEWPEPLMGAGNWIPELVARAGGMPLFAQPGKHSPYIDWEQLVAAAPEAIVVMPCGFDLERTRLEARALTQHPAWAELPAVKAGRAFIVDGNAYFNRPGPRLVESLEILAEILHPETCQFGWRDRAWDILRAN
ncbi:MAG: cobalamin-binding protein [Cyanobacteria bacterium J06641_5]